MFPANTYTIYEAMPAHRSELEHMAALDSRRLPEGRMLIGEIDGVPAAAISLEGGHLIADPFRRTSHLTAILRMRAKALATAERTPSVAERIRAGLRLARAAA
jgi:hypothetical protein